MPTPQKGETSDVIQLLISDVEGIRENLVGKWIFLIIMAIFLAINSFLWYEVRLVSRDIINLRAELATQVLERLKTDDLKRDAILAKIDSLTGEVHELKGAMDAHILSTKSK